METNKARPKIKNVIKWIGNFIVILALILIVKRLTSYDIDYSIFGEIENLLILGICSVLYGVLVILNAWPWKRIVEILTESEINMIVAAKIASKANLMKYLPGNVFQYVGKNELAIRCNLNHVEVASATVIDLLTNLFSVIVLIIVSYSSGIVKWLEFYGVQTFLFLLICVIIAVVIVAIAVLFRKKIRRYIESYKRLFKKKNICKIFENVLFYVLNNVLTGTLYIVVLKYVVGSSMEAGIPIIMGAYLLSWLLGFIMPGAPGGIGIRETAITVLLSGLMEVESILLAIVVYRVITTIGDVLGYVIMLAISQKRKGTES